MPKHQLLLDEDMLVFELFEPTKLVKEISIDSILEQEFKKLQQVFDISNKDNKNNNKQKCIEYKKKEPQDIFLKKKSVDKNKDFNDIDIENIHYMNKSESSYDTDNND